MKNVIERPIVPYNTPSNTVVNNEQLSLFAPVAGNGKVGMAGFNSDDFEVKNQIVFLNKFFKDTIFRKINLATGIIPDDITYKGADGEKTPNVCYYNYTTDNCMDIDENGEYTKITVTGTLFVADGTNAVTEILVANGKIWSRIFVKDNITEFVPITVPREEIASMQITFAETLGTVNELKQGMTDVKKRLTRNEAALLKKLEAPFYGYQFETVPQIRRWTAGASAEVDYIASTNGVAADVLVKRDATGNLLLPGPSNGYTLPETGDYAISVDQVNRLLNNLSQAIITGINVPKNGGRVENVVKKGDYGAYFMKSGNLTLKYTVGGNPVSIAGKVHFVWIYKDNDGWDRIVHYYMQNALSGLDHIDGTIESGITVVNADTAAGGRVIKMRMKSYKE